MKSDKKIFVAFILNLAFSVFECMGGIFTGSVAILSDALHDLGDAISIGASYILETKSKKQPDDIYTYGYARYSVLGSMVTTLILLLGSMAVFLNAAYRLFQPKNIDYNGMILFAVVGVFVNLMAAFFTREGDSLNQKAVNLHMLEDVLGWAVVLVGAVVMRFTRFVWIDPILSMGVAAFILIHAARGLKESLKVILEKTPNGISVQKIRERLTEIAEIQDIHHIHVWSMDGQNHYATMHVVTDGEAEEVKKVIRHVLHPYGIDHVTLELEEPGTHCEEERCAMEQKSCCGHHHHHHHHH